MKINDTFINNLEVVTRLHNGVGIPSIGFGTFQIPDGKEVIDVVVVPVIILFHLTLRTQLPSLI